MFSRQRRKRRFLYGLADIVLVFAAFELAYHTRTALPLERVFFLAAPVQALLLGAAAVLWPLAGIGLRVYDRLEAEAAGVILRDTLRQCAAAGVALVLIEYALRLDLSRPFLALFLLYAAGLLSLFRLNAPRLIGWLQRGFGEPYYVLIAGTGPRAERLARLLERSHALGVRLLGFVAADAEAGPLPAPLAARYPLHPLEEIPKLLDTQVIDEIIFVVDSKRLSELEDVLLMCDESGVQTRVAVDFFPHVNSEVYLDRLYQTPLLTFSAAPSDELRLMAKRVVDIVVSAAALMLLAPLMLLIAVLIRLTSPGPIIFRQQRCGLNGRRFTLYKFRSMCENAEELKPRLAHLNQKRTAFKIANDPRVTPLGRLLRKFSLDELPQLWNVLRGDMSLVGPRPPVPGEVEQYERWQRRRLRMRPGLTCLWALEGRDELEFDTWIRKDLEYIDNWSLGLDLTILMRTIPSVLTGKGAH